MLMKAWSRWLSGDSLTKNALAKCPRRESNTNLQFRKPSFYPLNYGGVDAGWGGR
jgi:hypothetical protein